MKRILITGGPTNEFIDEVMKITNMSTGSLAVSLGEHFLRGGYEVCMVLNHSVFSRDLTAAAGAVERCRIIGIETTEDMYRAIETESGKNPYDAVIHASAVGDYKAEFSFLLEDLAEEIYMKKDLLDSPEAVLTLMENPGCRLDDSSKISSYQKNLTVKLGLTPKIIGRLREWFPDALLVGCKLLENVSKEELFEVAAALCRKNRMDYILANDLADLRKGMPARYLVGNDGFTGTVLEDPKAIYEFVKRKEER